jgi:hypothetical protein
MRLQADFPGPVMERLLCVAATGTDKESKRGQREAAPFFYIRKRGATLFSSTHSVTASPDLSGLRMTATAKSL